MKTTILCKTCFICMQKKPIGLFYKHQAMADGHLNKCIECTKAYVRHHRRTTPYAREYDRRRYHEDPKRRASHSADAKRWAEQNPLKRKAQNAVGYAVASGQLKRQPCEVCGSKAHAHHEDYRKPLIVQWLCPIHHQQLHHRKRASP